MQKALIWGLILSFWPLLQILCVVKGRSRLDPAMSIYNVGTMDEHVRGAYVLPHVAAMLFGVRRNRGAGYGGLVRRC